MNLCIFLFILSFAIANSHQLLRSLAPKGEKTASNHDPILDFKLTALYFADSVLKGVKIAGQEVEGAIFLDVFVAISKILAEQSDQRLKKLSESFNRGSRYREQIDQFISQRARKYDPAKLEQEIQVVQTELFDTIKSGNEVSFPSGWNSHAIVMSLAPSPNNKNSFDLRVFNLGAGNQFHELAADEAGTYPYLVKPWLSFIGIPWSAVDQDLFFTVGQMNMLDLDNVPSTQMDNYFYKEFLANFDAYLVKQPANEPSIYNVPQRSGTCTVSSCMARIMFEHESVADYAQTRVQIGVFMLKSFLKKYEKDKMILQMAASGIHFKKIFRFALSSLARDAFTMLELKKTAKQYTCYPITAKLKVFIDAVQSGICDSRIENKEQKLLRDIAKIALQIIHWIEGIKLDLSKYSIKAPSERGIIHFESDSNNDLFEKAMTTVDFHTKLSVTTSAINPPANLLTDKQIKSDKSLESALKKAVSPTSCFCVDLVNINKAMDFDAIFESLDESIDWHRAYSGILTKLSHRLNSVNLDSVLAFHKISFYIWKIAVLQDARRGPRSLGLADYAPPDGMCPLDGYSLGNKIAGDGIDKWERIQAYSPSLYDEVLQFCELVKSEAKDKSELVKFDLDSRRLDVDSVIIDKLRKSPEFQKFVYEEKLTSLQLRSFPEMIKCAASSELTRAYPLFYLIELISFAVKSLLVSQKYEPSSSLHACYYYMTGLLRGAEYWKTVQDVNPFKKSDAPFVVKTMQDLSSSNTITPFSALIDELESVNAANLVKVPEFLQALDKLIFYSPKINEIMKEQPKFGKRLFAALGSVFEMQAENLTFEFIKPDAKVDEIQAELDKFADFCFVFARAVFKVTALSEKQFEEPAEKYWSRLHSFWFKLSGFNRSVRKFDVLIDEGRLGRINYLLAYVLSLTRQRAAFRHVVAEAYGDCSEAIEDITSAMIGHHFAGKYYFAKKIKNKVKPPCLLDELYDSQFLLNEVQDEINSRRFSDLILRHLMCIFLERITGAGVKYVEASSFTTTDESDPDLIKLDHPAGIEEKVYEVRISIASVTVNGAQIQSKQDFFNDDTFKTFFSIDLKFASSHGALNYYYGRDPVYELKGFLVQGGDYRVVKNIVSFQTEIYRKITHAGSSKYFIYNERDKAALGQKFGLVNTEGLDLFVYEQESAAELAWIRRDEREVVYFGKATKDKRFLEIPAFNSDRFELPANNFNLNELISPVIKTFASNIPISIYVHEGDLIVLLQPFNMENTAPLAFRVDSTKTTLMSDPSFVLHDKQVMNESEPFTPMLILKKENQVDYFIGLVPNFDYNKFLKDAKGYSAANVIKVHTIELKSDLSGFNPQTRTEKLLLAYHSLHQWNFKEALKLLDRDSILHNVPFNQEELGLLQKIVALKGVSHPEGMALQLMAYLHIKLHELETLSVVVFEEQGDKDENGEELTFDKVLFEYLMSMRDISQQFYIHLKFPELIREGLGLFDYEAEQLGIEPSIKQSVTESFFFNAEHYNAGSITEKIRSADEYSELAFAQVLKVLSKGNHLPSQVKNLKIIKGIIDNPANNGIDELKLLRPEINQNSTLAYCLVKGINNKQLIKDIVDSLTKFAEEEIKIQRSWGIIINAPSCASFGVKSDGFAALSSLFTTRPTLVSKEKIVSLMRADIERKLQVKRSDSQALDVPRISTYDDAVLFYETAQEIQQEWFVNGAISSQSIAASGTVIAELNKAIEAFDQERRVLDLEKFRQSRSLIPLLAYLNERITVIRKQTEKHEQELLLLTSNPTEKSAMTRILSFLDKIFHQKKDKLFGNLYSCYFANSSECFSSKFLHLKPEEVKQLQNLTFVYYAKSNLLNFFRFVSEKAEELEALQKIATPQDTFKIEILAKDLLAELQKMAKFEERVKHPGILNFEFRSGSVRLREEQIDDVVKLVDSKSSGLPASNVIQRMMAAGKTFVLGTLASVLKANGKNLSILVPPSSLYQSNALSMQERTLKFFKTRGKTFHFPRLSLGKKVQSVRFLKLVLDRINRAIQNKEYLIMDPSDLSAFHNSFIEYFENLRLYEHEADISWHVAEVLELHAEIFHIFKTKTSIILDEIDMTMAPNLELNYPTQEKEQMNMNAAALSADLILFTAFSKEIEELGLQILSNNQDNFDQSRFDSVREHWKAHVTEMLKDKNGIWHRFIINPNKLFFADEANVSHAIDFIFASNLPQHFANKLKAINTETHSTLAILRMQVQRWIPDSFNGAVFEKFGPSIENWSSIKYAIPYLSANTPSERSVFADRWETLNKTLLMYIMKPFTFEEISSLASEILTMRSEQEIGSLEVERTFYDLTGVQLGDVLFDSNNLIAGHNNAELERSFSDKSDPRVLKLIFIYVLRVVMEPIEYFQEQITSNALNMTSMFGSVQGYSGTIDNINTLPWQLVSIAADERLENEKNNGGIVSKLLQDAEPVTVMNCLPECAQEIFEEALRDSNAQEFNAFIDVGAFFKAFRNVQVAEAVLAKFSHIQAVIYYDEKSNQTRFVKRDAPGKQFELPTTDLKVIDELTKVPIEQRFTFYDQRHITGSDIRQHPTAKALLSIGPKVLLRDILQGTLRLRQFMAGQKARFVTTASVVDLLRGKGIEVTERVGIDHLVALSAANEDEKQGKENIKLAFTKIDNEIRNFVLEALAKDVADGTSAAEIVKKFNAARKLFIRSTREDPSAWLKEVELLDTNHVLNSHFESKMQELGDNFTNLDQLKGRIEALIADYKQRRFLSEKIPMSVSSTEGVELKLEIQTLQEQQQEQDTELSLEALLQQQLNNVQDDWKPPIYPDSFNAIYQHTIGRSRTVFVEGSEAVRKLKPTEQEIISIGLGPLNLSFQSSLLSHSPGFFSARATFFSKDSKEGHGLVFFRDQENNRERLLLVDAEAMNTILKDVKQQKYSASAVKGYQYCFTDMTGQYIGPASEESFLIKSDLFDIPGFHERHMGAFFKAHLFNGAMNHIFSLPELRQEFGRWLRLRDLKPEARALPNVFKRLRFLALKLKCHRKDEFIFDKPTDPFIKLL